MPSDSTSPPPTTPSSSRLSDSRRKRSSPTNTLHSHSSNSSLVYPVPDNIAWLDQLTLSVSIVHGPKLKTKDARYELHIHHAKSQITWSHSRSFDDYRSFQLRLQKALRHGHFCHAECPWLYTFVKSYFPKSYMFGALLAPRCAIDTRRETFERCFHTLQTFLSNRNNHCCSVLTSAVADEVVAFVNGDVGKTHQCRLAPVASSECAALAALAHANSSSSLPRKSWDSVENADGIELSRVAPEEREPNEDSPRSSSSEEDLCPICKVHLAEEANTPTSSISAPTSTTSESTVQSVGDVQVPPVPTLVLPPRPPTSRPKATSQPPRRVGAPHFYTTKLACGHRFHDECIVPHLNESMNCPVCGQEEVKQA